jgi:predicted porin
VYIKNNGNEMKKLIFAASIGAFSAATFGQSSVTLYGTVDDGVQYVNNAGGRYLVNAQQGGLGSSKWGLIGAEDIGGGTKVIFRIEGGFDPNSGKPNLAGYEFNRQAYVGAEGAFGSVKLGRQFDLSYLDGIGPLAAPNRIGGGLATHAGDVDNLWGTVNIQNAVKYITPDLWGARVGGLYGFGNSPGALSTRQVLNFIATYANGPISLAAGYLKINNPATSVWGGASDPVSGSAFTNPLTNPIYSGYASAHTYQIIDAGGSYTFGGVTGGLVFSQVNFQDVLRTTSTPFAGTAIFRTGEANLAYQITPSAYAGIATSYTYTDSAHYLQFDLGGKYSLSKRTLLYVTGAWQHASGTNSLGRPAVAGIYGVSASTTQNQVAVRAGIRHNF